MKAIDPSATFEYVPKCDRDLPEEAQTVFILKYMDARQAAKMEDQAVEGAVSSKGDDTSLRFRSGSKVLQALEYGLRGWRNFQDKGGNEIPFRENNGKPRPENFDAIPPSVRRELANVIIDGSEMSEGEEKN
ncbi:hypothetical protein [Nitrospina gracilis]|uniref:hypothetical protein n=1 Tax=Nitrospina gracilis TaxID=35801 RepID=UPI001F355C04|nr:hypothetical protein [Nitrospina gracilis]MCF8719211.1 hypothetical protein [Nitrospina gracilis Nb-211]